MHQSTNALEMVVDDGAHNDIRQDIKCHTGAMWQLKLFFFTINLLPSKRAKKWEIYFATFSSCAQSLHTFCGVTSIDKAFHSASRSFPSLSFYCNIQFCRPCGQSEVECLCQCSPLSQVNHWFLFNPILKMTMIMIFATGRSGEPAWRSRREGRLF